MAKRQDHPSADPELSEQRRGDPGSRGGDETAVERLGFGPTVVPVAVAEPGAAAQRGENPFGRAK